MTQILGVEKCWTEGCDKPQSTERIGYWCTEHHDERRARITKLMSELANDSQGNPRKPAEPVFEDLKSRQCIGITGKGKRCSRKGQPTVSGGYRCSSHRGILS